MIPAFKKQGQSSIFVKKSMHLILRVELFSRSWFDLVIKYFSWQRKPSQLVLIGNQFAENLGLLTVLVANFSNESILLSSNFFISAFFNSSA